MRWIEHQKPLLPFTGWGQNRYHRALMFGALPQLIEVERFAVKRKRIEGAFAVASLDRLMQMVAGPDGEVGFALEFFRDEQGQSRISGTIQGSVMLTCQRCLQPVRHELVACVELMALVDESALSQLPGDVEPLLTGGQPVRLADLVEDEALLALPIVASHPQCSPPSHDKSGDEDGNPFAALKRKE